MVVLLFLMLILVLLLLLSRLLVVRVFFNWLLMWLKVGLKLMEILLLIF